MITDRKPVGSINFEAGGLHITHGTVDGNIIDISCPSVQLSGINYNDSDRILMFESSLVPMPKMGNDELMITLR